MSSTVYLLLVVLLCDCLASGFRITGPLVAANLSPDRLPQRREINDFVNAGPEFDLFILAFQRMQVRQQSDPLSYFGIAGIHGYPRQGWDGVDGDGRYSGFCAHAAVIFPTWHRAYLTLFEQMISQHAQTIAELYPPDRRNMYRDAAQNVRLPYWDWAVHAALPEVTTQPNIIVDTPEGRQSIRNPLYEYVFHPGPQGNGFPAGHPLSNLTATTRYFDRATGQRNDSAATAVLLANAANTLTMTYQLLSSITNYTAMSCTFPGGVPNRQVNLESIHNYIHNFIGGYYGHMFWPELSAFDPIFWLHHANVDRLFAIWQTLNPNAYIVPTTNRFGTYAVRPGSIDSGSSGLMPFHMDEGSTMFTSDELRDITRLGYTYPELEETHLSEPDRMAYIRRQVNAMYAPNPEPSTDSTAGADKRSTGHFPGVSLKLAKQLAVNNALTQWSVAIQVDQASFDTSYSLDFFMGPPPTVSERSTAPNLVATYGQFVTDRSCDTEFEQLPSRLLSGEVALTHVLSAAVTRGDIYDLSPTSVLPVLQEQLTWAARTSEDQEIDLSQLRGLEIVVQSREVTPRSADCEFPVYGAVTIHPEAVQNKLGASRFFKEEQRHRPPGQGMKSMWPRNQTK